ncbi:unnamed protein product, partial [Trichogramma brassicae]
MEKSLSQRVIFNENFQYIFLLQKNVIILINLTKCFLSVLDHQADSGYIIHSLAVLCSSSSSSSSSSAATRTKSLSGSVFKNTSIFAHRARNERDLRTGIHTCARPSNVAEYTWDARKRMHDGGEQKKSTLLDHRSNIISNCNVWSSCSWNMSFKRRSQAKLVDVFTARKVHARECSYSYTWSNDENLRCREPRNGSRRTELRAAAPFCEAQRRRKGHRLYTCVSIGKRFHTLYSGKHCFSGLAYQSLGLLFFESFFYTRYPGYTPRSELNLQSLAWFNSLTRVHSIGTLHSKPHFADPPGAPYIEGYVEGETLRRGQQIELACKSRGGNPAAQVIWYRNGETVHSVYTTEGKVSKNVYSFIAQPSDDKARFECKVTNVMSVTPMSTHVDLTVLFAPATVKLEGPTEARAEERVTISCVTDISNPASEIKWVVDNQKIESTQHVTEAAMGGFITSSNITFTINKMAQRAVVVCHANNIKLSETIVGTQTINVIYPPSRLEMSGYEAGTAVLAGSVLKLSCTAISGNPLATITWYKNDNKVTSVTKQRDHAVTSELALVVNASDNKANIRCEASNSATQVPLVQSAVLNVNFLPDTVKISTIPKDFKAGERGRLLCESTSSNPKAEMSWWKAGSPVLGTNTSSKAGLYGGIISQVELALDLTEDMNGEEYTCQAKISDIDRSVHDTTKLNILYKPVFENLEATELVGMEGEPFVISVAARGNPAAITYSWTRDGLPLSSNVARSRITARGSTLNITRLERLDAGTYVCEAINDRGQTFYHLNLTVQFGPEMANTPLTKKAAVNNGANAQLYCKARGSPLPHFTWVYNGKTIMPNRTENKYSLTYTNLSVLYSQSILTVYKVEQSDYGKYECIAQNKYGQDLQTVGLDVTSPPDEPVDLEAHNITHNSVTLAWKSGFDGGLSTSYQIRWREARDDETNYHYLDVSPGTHRAVVDHLELGTYYVFSIRARNTKGESPFLPDLLKVQTLRPDSAENLPDVLREKSERPLKYVYTIGAISIIFFVVNVFFMLWYIVRKKNRDRINKSQTADMYAPSTVNGDTMTGELSSVSDEKSDVNFDANDYVVSAI